MTEAEFVEAITSYVGVAAVQSTQGLGLLFAYIIVAYLVGSKLTRKQVLAISFLYVPIYVSTIAATMAAQVRAGVYAQRLKELRPDDVIFLGYGNQIFPAVFGMLCLLASLWFMWSVRHPKNK